MLPCIHMRVPCPGARRALPTAATPAFSPSLRPARDASVLVPDLAASSPPPPLPGRVPVGPHRRGRSVGKVIPDLRTRVREGEVMDAPGLAPAEHRAALVALSRVNLVSRTAGRITGELARLELKA